ncbi:secondary thiamine-phosphate synthase enzyme [Parapedobacter composti]|uniref:Secondary thiamine-phosphate synthase enzyme n=1 Tax=Parapedobacter composti TaxID=623281 RepID=A0A1I1JHY3_9SPHI|nr:secondary thiamine-phosphate synthase enzyme YjbQ [Parapedobacter composti]SFC46238.1 secondary thiamine-phosphate synthase enzyme [Parapedobacter composti]
MEIFQQNLVLRARPRGYHLITDELNDCLQGIRHWKTGMCHIFIQHTSASLTVNENADPTVRMDFETYFNKAVPENDPDYRHDYEGADDMPAHIKASLMGASVTIPVQQGRLALGTWQGIYLCEHRNQGGSRHLVVTAWGQ